MSRARPTTTSDTDTKIAESRCDASTWPAGSWRLLPNCPGRSVWVGPYDRRPSDLAGSGAAVLVFAVAAAPDPVHVAAFDDGGGLISYEKHAGRFVHTLNTPEGFARKLQHLGIRLGS